MEILQQQKKYMSTFERISAQNKKFISLLGDEIICNK